MARKNIFQLVEESYSIQDEISKIHTLFVNQDYFYQGTAQYTLYDVLQMFLFVEWEYRGTCLSIEEYLDRANAVIPDEEPATEEVIINYLEVMENFIKLYLDKHDELHIQRGVNLYSEFVIVFCNLVKTLEKHMGLTRREYKDRVLLYPESAPLEKVIDLCDDDDVQWELIRYVREDLSLDEKRKTLAYLATKLYIEKDKIEQDEHILYHLERADNILNNLHIRHNNQTGKWENGLLEAIDEEKQISLCDFAYNEMLVIVLLRNNKGYDTIYREFSRLEKEHREDKKRRKQNGQAEDAQHG